MYEFIDFKYPLSTKSDIPELSGFNWLNAYSNFLNTFNFFSESEIIFRGVIESTLSSNNLKINIVGKDENKTLKFKLIVLNMNGNSNVDYTIADNVDIVNEGGVITVGEGVTDTIISLSYATMSSGVKVVFEQSVIGASSEVYSFIDMDYFTLEYYEDENNVYSTELLQDITWNITKLSFKYKLDKWGFEYNNLTNEFTLITDKYGNYVYSGCKLLYDDGEFLYAHGMIDPTNGCLMYNRFNSNNNYFIGGFVWLKRADDNKNHEFYRSVVGHNKYHVTYIETFKKHPTWTSYFFYKAYPFREYFNVPNTFYNEESILPLPITYLDENYDEVDLDVIKLSTRFENEIDVKTVNINGANYLKIRAPKLKTFPLLFKMDD